MKTIMYCCVILHNMVVEEKRTLVEIEEGSAINTVVSDEVECCFVQDPSVHRPMKGTVTALCATHRYLNQAYEYMRTRMIIFAKIVKERLQKKN